MLWCPIYMCVHERKTELCASVCLWFHSCWGNNRITLHRVVKVYLKLKSFIQNWPESQFMLIEFKYCVASCLHASAGGNNWQTQLAFIESYNWWYSLPSGLPVRTVYNDPYLKLYVAYETGDDCNSLLLTVLCRSSLFPATGLNWHNRPWNFWITIVYTCSSRSCI